MYQLQKRWNKVSNFLKKFFFLLNYSWETQRHRQREKQAPLQGTRYGTQSRTPGHDLCQRQMLNLWATQESLRVSSCCCFKDFIYIFMRDTERQRHRQREKQAPHREPNAGLDPQIGITPWAKGRCSITEPPRNPLLELFKANLRHILHVCHLVCVFTRWGFFVCLFKSIYVLLF